LLQKVISGIKKEQAVSKNNKYLIFIPCTAPFYLNPVIQYQFFNLAISSDFQRQKNIYYIFSVNYRPVFYLSNICFFSKRELTRIIIFYQSKIKI